MSTTENQIGVNTNLQKQDLKNLDISHLTPLSPEVISRQATINIGTIGHVAHGKSTVVKAISGVQTVRFKNELERNITIKLERISYNYIQKLLNSAAECLRYEKRQEEYLRSLSMQRKYWYNRSNPLSNSKERSVSASPSSGYESVNENGLSYNFERTARRRMKGESRCFKRNSMDTVSKKQLLSKNSKTKYNTNTNTNSENKEYAVEQIQAIDTIDGQPVFYVKWVNYPDDQNTWETYDNLRECMFLEQFIRDAYKDKYDIIKNIIMELKKEITKDSKPIVDMNLIDSFDPLIIKRDLVLLAQYKITHSNSKKDIAKLRESIKDSMVMGHLYKKREKQCEILAEFKRRMNEIETQSPIDVVNNVDFDVPDPNFQYIKDNFAGKDVFICNTPCWGCNCKIGCSTISKCCARWAGSIFPYDKMGKLRVHPGGAIYECNSRCNCDKSCPTRIIQRGRKNELCLFKTSNDCGWGVRTQRKIMKGEFVAEYIGEIIKTEEANIRGLSYDAIGRTYLFDLDYCPTGESLYTVDAGIYGNISHFINHSCDPNLIVYPFWIENLDVNMPRLAFFSARTISAGEELTFDYMRSDIDNDYKNLSTAEKVPCRCGASRCRGYLF